MKKKNKFPIKLFILAFAVLGAVTLYQNLSRQQVTALVVEDNKGVSFLETAGDWLVCIFQDGRTCVWDWAAPHPQRGDFSAAGTRAVLLDAQRLAAVPLAGEKNLAVYSLPSGQKLQEFSVGFGDQDVWLKTSCDKSAVALIRRNPEQSNRILYEFMTVDLDNRMTGLPGTLTIEAKKESLVDYAVDAGSVLYAVGSRDEVGRIVAIDLKTGAVKWDRVYKDTGEFCSVTDSPGGRYLLAGNRDGILYKIDPSGGDILKQVVLLEPGETRTTTNDFSVLNLAFSPDGTHYAATIHPVAYLLDVKSDAVVHKLQPADKLVSKVAFSPDSQFFATSDIRAGYPVRLRPMPEEE